MVPDHAPLIERAFSIAVREGTFQLDVTGTLPSYLRGTAYWNGPGRFVRGGLHYRNWLDGDGLVCALTFGDIPRLTARFVRSEKFVQEESAGRPLFRQFGTAFDGDRLKRGIALESPANVSVYPFGGTLLAFGEQGLPWEVDRSTLDTRGRFTFDGQLNEVTPFSAHPKFDHGTGEMFNFGVSFDVNDATLHYFKFAASGRLECRRRVPLPYPASIHDFAISATYATFYVSPLVLDVQAFIRSRVPLIDALRWEPERGSRLMVVARHTGELVASVPLGGKYCLHLVNAFESAAELVVDVIEYDRPLYDQYQIIPSLFTEVSNGLPTRIVVDVAGARVVDRRTLDYSCAPDFPAHDVALTGQNYGDFWMLGIGATGQPGRKFLDQIVRLNWDRDEVDIYRAPPGQYLGGEPIFLPDPAGAGGVVICQVFDAALERTAFLVFDAFHVSRGPLARLESPQPIPLLFHSSQASASEREV